MKKAAFVVPFICRSNRIFDLTDTFINRDNCMVSFSKLKTKLAQFGYDLSTHDINTVDESEFVLYLEMPRILPRPEHIKKSYLLLYETELVLPQNWNMAKHKSFHKIFTWNDSLVDNKKYFKMNWAHVFPERIEYNPAEKTRFCCMIAGNKSSTHELELYSKRLEAVRWFEQEHPDQFDLFGMGWNEVRLPGNHYFERYKALKFFKKMLNCFAPKFPSYRGKVDNKLDTLRSYKFSICYENARDIPGYITEKIFDCFFAACIPVYWGPKNISAHIPAECYINMRQYQSYEALYTQLVNMHAQEHRSYIDSISSYLASSQATEFTADYFADTIAKELLSNSIED